MASSGGTIPLSVAAFARKTVINGGSLFAFSVGEDLRKRFLEVLDTFLIVEN